MINYMKFDVMWMDDVIATVDLKPVNGGTPYVINYINDFNKQFSPTRANADELLESLGMQAYNRWGKTHGVMADDEIWLRFEGETLRHKDVCLRKELYYPESAAENS